MALLQFSITHLIFAITLQQTGSSQTKHLTSACIPTDCPNPNSKHWQFFQDSLQCCQLPELFHCQADDAGNVQVACAVPRVCPSGRLGVVIGDRVECKACKTDAQSIIPRMSHLITKVKTSCKNKDNDQSNFILKNEAVQNIKNYPNFKTVGCRRDGYGGRRRCRRSAAAAAANDDGINFEVQSPQKMFQSSKENLILTNVSSPQFVKTETELPLSNRDLNDIGGKEKESAISSHWVQLGTVAVILVCVFLILLVLMLGVFKYYERHQLANKSFHVDYTFHFPGQSCTRLIPKITEVV